MEGQVVEMVSSSMIAWKYKEGKLYLGGGKAALSAALASAGSSGVEGDGGTGWAEVFEVEGKAMAGKCKLKPVNWEAVSCELVMNNLVSVENLLRLDSRC